MQRHARSSAESDLEILTDESGFGIIVEDGTVRLRGDVDLAAVSRLRDGLRRACADAAVVRVDLCDVSFMDSSGLTELIRPAHDGVEVVLTGVPPRVAVVLEITGLDVAFRIESVPRCHPPTDGSRPLLGMDPPSAGS